MSQSSFSLVDLYASESDLDETSSDGGDSDSEETEDDDWTEESD